MKWLVHSGHSYMPTSMLQDENCPEKLVEVTGVKDERECVPAPTVTPTKTPTKSPTPTPAPNYACYVCNEDSHKYSWKDNDSGDTNCPSGYTKTNKPQSECVNEQPACYVCKTDNTKYIWKYDGNADDECLHGYNKTSKNLSECHFENPKTGSTGITLAWIIGIMAIGYSTWYFKKHILDIK